MISPEMPFISVPFGYWDDNRQAIPVVTSYNQENNELSQRYGIPLAYSVPKANGGKVLTRHELNQIGYMATCASFYYQIGYGPTFNQDVCKAIGGYPKGAILKYIKYDSIGRVVSASDVVSLKDDNFYDFRDDHDKTWPYVCTPGDGSLSWDYLYTKSDFSGAFPDYSTLEKKFEKTYSVSEESVIFDTQNKRLWGMFTVKDPKWDEKISTGINIISPRNKIEFSAIQNYGNATPLVLTNDLSIDGSLVSVCPLPVNSKIKVKAVMDKTDSPLKASFSIMEGVHD